MLWAPFIPTSLQMSVLDLSFRPSMRVPRSWFQVVPINPDGNCLFTCFAVGSRLSINQGFHRHCLRFVVLRNTSARPCTNTPQHKLLFPVHRCRHSVAQEQEPGFAHAHVSGSTIGLLCTCVVWLEPSCASSGRVLSRQPATTLTDKDKIYWGTRCRVRYLQKLKASWSSLATRPRCPSGSVLIVW